MSVTTELIGTMYVLSPTVTLPDGLTWLPLTMQPFVEPLPLIISFITTPGTGHLYPLTLPVALHNFCEPVAMAGDDYKARWGALAGAPRELTAAITPGSGASSSDKAKESLGKIHMAVLDVAGAPGAPGASSCRTLSVNASGATISVGCLAMIIAAGPVYKVAVRTQHADVTKSLMASLTKLLEGS